MNKKQGGNFAALSPTDFIAAVTQHIPDKGFQLVRYYGWYSNKARGVRAKTARRKPKTLLKAMSRIVRPPRPSGGGSSPGSGRPTR